MAQATVDEYLESVYYDPKRPESFDFYGLGIPTSRTNQ